MKGTRHNNPGKKRADLLRDHIVEALRWLDVRAPGRAHNTLTEALRGEGMRIVFTNTKKPF